MSCLQAQGQIGLVYGILDLVLTCDVSKPYLNPGPEKWTLKWSPEWTMDKQYPPVEKWQPHRYLFSPESRVGSDFVALASVGTSNQ